MLLRYLPLHPSVCLGDYESFFIKKKESNTDKITEPSVSPSFCSASPTSQRNLYRELNLCLYEPFLYLTYIYLYPHSRILLFIMVQL